MNGIFQAIGAIAGMVTGIDKNKKDQINQYNAQLLASGDFQNSLTAAQYQAKLTERWTVLAICIIGTLFLAFLVWRLTK